MALLKQQLVRGVTGSGSVFDTIVNFLTGAPGTPGRDWVIHADYRASAGMVTANYQYNRVVLRNTGKSNNENIHIGLYAVVHSAGIEAGIILKAYTYFDNAVIPKTGGNDFATPFMDTTYGNGHGNYDCKSFIPFKTDESAVPESKPPIELWVYSNKARVIIVINTEGRFANGYVGQYIRHLTPQEVPHPLVVLADSFNGGNSVWGGVTEALWNYYLGYTTVDWDNGLTFERHRRNLCWSNHGNWSFATSWTERRAFAGNRIRTPVGWSYDWLMDPTQPDHSTYNVLEATHFNYPDNGFELLLFPIYMYAYTASQSGLYLLGQLDGVYWAPNQRNTILSEVGSSDCIIFPDLNRTNWWSWMALRDEL
jgi:hypothetical protein